MGFPGRGIMRAVRPSDETGEGGTHLPAATVQRSSLNWWLWLIPLGAAALCVWFLYRDFVSAGPLITIYFQDAEGLEEGNTQVTYRGAMVGQVKGVSLAPDTQRVKVSARLKGS